MTTESTPPRAQNLPLEAKRLQAGSARAVERPSEVLDRLLVGQLFRASIHIEVVFEVRDSPTAGPAGEKSASTEADPEVRLYRHLRRLERDLEERIASELRESADLGDVQIERLSIQQGGSIEIVVLVTTAFTVLRHYNQLYDEITKAVRNTRSIVNGIVDAWSATSPTATASVSATWFPGGALSALSGIALEAAQAPTPAGTRRALPGERRIRWPLFAIAAATPAFLLGLAIAGHVAFAHL